MGKRSFFRSTGVFNKESNSWLYVNNEANHDGYNTYLHDWHLFRTKEEALDWLDSCVAKVEQPDWTLFSKDTSGRS